MTPNQYKNAVVTCTDCGVTIKNLVFGQHPMNGCKNEGQAWFMGSITFTWDTTQEAAPKMSTKELISRAQARPETYLPALAATIQDLEFENEELKLELGRLRLCVVCGKTRPSDEGKGDLPACVDPDTGLSGCTWDATPTEAWLYWRDKAHQYHQALQQQIKFRKLGY